MCAMVAILLVLSALTACAVPASAPVEDAMLQDAAMGMTHREAGYTYRVELESETETVRDTDGVLLAACTIQRPVLSAVREDGTEPENPPEAVEVFNREFDAWLAEPEELAGMAREHRSLCMESPELEWLPYSTELSCEIYQTELLISVSGRYYSNTGGAHPNTLLLSWNFDLTTGQFFTAEGLAKDGEDFSRAVCRELLRQAEEPREDGTVPRQEYWDDAEEILASDWSSCAVFDGTGMSVRFSPYELAPYGAGAQEFHLDKALIRSYLSDHGLELLRHE